MTSESLCSCSHKKATLQSFLKLYPHTTSSCVHQQLFRKTVRHTTLLPTPDLCKFARGRSLLLGREHVRVTWMRVYIAWAWILFESHLEIGQEMNLVHFVHRAHFSLVSESSPPFFPPFWEFLRLLSCPTFGKHTRSNDRRRFRPFRPI